MKKVLSLVVALAMLLSMVPSVFAVEDQLPPDVEVQGTVDNPIWLNAGENKVTIPAGATVYYVGRFTGMIMRATGAGLVLEHNSTIYTLGEEITEFACYQASFFEPSSFAITNNTDAAVECYMEVVYPLGSAMNPEELVLGWNSVLVEAGTEGRYFIWTAEEDGTLGVEMYNESGWFYVVNNMTANQYGDQYNSDDSNGKVPVPYSEYQVSAGDQIQIIVNTFDKESPYSAPEGEVGFGVYFTPPVGTESNPILLEDVNNVTVPAGKTLYCVGRFNGLTVNAVGEGLVLAHNGETYELGEVATEFVFSQPNDWEAGLLTITNSGDADAEFTLTVIYPLGAMQNPAALEIGDNSATINEGSQGYYYTWTAEADGTLTIEVSGNNGWFYVVNNLTAYQYGEQHTSGDETIVPVTQIEVAAGDEIQIQVNTFDKASPWLAPAGEVSFRLSFEAKEVEEVRKGDVDGNGKVNLRDALMLLQFVNGKELAQAPNESACDVDGNSKVNLRDALMLLQIVNGKEF